MSGKRPLWQLDTRCPKCGRPPRLAFTTAQLAKWAADPPETVVQTYQCSFQVRPGRRCNTIYEVTAGDLQRARRLVG